MCLLLFAYGVDPDYPLIVAANRDEFHGRATAPAQWWQDRPVLAGRDLDAGGTWMGVSRTGRFAAITNYRDPASQQVGLRSRGQLVLDALDPAIPAAELLDRLRADGHRYNGFNLVFGGVDGLFCYGSRGEAAALSPGLYGLSNHLLETPWPKVVRGKTALRRYLDSGQAPALEPLLDLLHDRAPAADAELPDTGVGIEVERRLAAMFIVDPRHGTRASTALTVSGDGEVRFAERSFGADGERTGSLEFRFHRLAGSE